MMNDLVMNLNEYLLMFLALCYINTVISFLMKCIVGLTSDLSQFCRYNAMISYTP